MLKTLFIGFFIFNTGCHEPCKNGYGRAADKLCYPLAEDPEAPCGEGFARTDEGNCVSITEAATGSSTTAGGSGATTGGGTGGGGGSADTTGSFGSGESDAGTDGAIGDDGGGSGSIDTGITTGAATGTGATDGGEDLGTTTIKGVLNTTDGLGFAEGDSILIQVWSIDSMIEATGEPMEDAMPRANAVANAAVTALSIHFDLNVSDVPAEGERVRLTAHLTDDLLDWEGSPVGLFPADPSIWETILPDVMLEEVYIVIDNSGEGGGTTSGGTPTDTGLPPLGGGADSSGSGPAG